MNSRYLKILFSNQILWIVTTTGEKPRYLFHISTTDDLKFTTRSVKDLAMECIKKKRISSKGDIKVRQYKILTVL